MIRVVLICTLAFFLCTQLRGTTDPMYVRVPGFARAAALVDGEKLLQIPGNFQLLHDLIPGIREKKLVSADLAHRYLIFASEDLKIYGMVIRKGKGSLEKLYNAFRSNPNTIKLRYEKQEFLSALWAKECTVSLLFKREKQLFKHLYKSNTITAAAVIRLKELPYKSVEKLLKEFPELKHLEVIRVNAGGKELQTGALFLFDNPRSPAKGFRLLNWGLTFLLWHKTGKFRIIRQETEQKELRLYLSKPPVGEIARRLVPKAPPEKAKRTSTTNLKQLATGLFMYMVDHKEQLPPDLNEIFQHYIPDPSVYIAPSDKKRVPAKRGEFLKKSNTSYVYLLPGVPFKKIKSPALTPVLMEHPRCLPPKRAKLIVAYADGHTAAVKLPSLSKLSCRRAVEELLKSSKGKISAELTTYLLENAAAADREISGNP